MKAGCDRVFRDRASGAKDDRQGLAEALQYAREGDTLVVWKLDRLGRSLSHSIPSTARPREDGQRYSAWAFDGALKHTELMAQGKDLDLKCSATPDYGALTLN